MLVLIGASASGKTEIAKILIKNYKFKKILYLYRGALDTVFSFVKFNIRNPEENIHFSYTTEEEGFEDFTWGDEETTLLFQVPFKVDKIGRAHV